MRYRAALTIPIELRRDVPQPLYRQIARQIGTAVDEGRLATGAALPATRTLGALLGVSRGVVAAAYDLLSARGYLLGRPGSGNFVAVPAASAGSPPAKPAPPARPTRRTRSVATHPAGSTDLTDLRPGGPDPDEFPVRQWRAAWRRASFAPPPAHPPPPLGLPELRRAIAAHLRDTRGLPPAGGEVVVTGGTAAGVRLVLAGLGLAGSQVAVEDPAPPALRRAVPPGPGEPVPLPVDPAGAATGAIPPGCRAVVVSPDAHDPLGYVLSAHRRRLATAWARTTGGWLVEVACDAVFRPHADRLPPLSGLAAGGPPSPAERGGAVLVGGFGAVLGPAPGLGYAVVPAALADRLRELIADRAEQPPYLLQRVMAELLAGGTVVRMMHRLGRAYRRKRRLVEPVLRPLGALARPGGVGTAVLCLPGGQDGRAVAAALRERGVRVRPLADYHAPGRLPAPARSGLVVGYGHLPDPALRTGLAALARELAGSGEGRAG